MDHPVKSTNIYGDNQGNENVFPLKVCLWLGANVMLEYTLPAAEELLSKNKASAEKNLGQISYDLDFLRDQMTITEVTMARLYNWDVRRRQQLKAEGKDKPEEK